MILLYVPHQETIDESTVWTYRLAFACYICNV